MAMLQLNRFERRCAALVAVAALAAGLTSGRAAARQQQLALPQDQAMPVELQAELNNLPIGQFFVRGAEPQSTDVAANTEGATLKVDPDLEAILKKAERYQADGNYLLATRLWQTVLEQSGDVLYSHDGQLYHSLADHVQQVLANLSPEALRTYRISADAGARELLAQARGDYDTDVLARIVKQYFLSELGDEAAFQLGQIYLDRHDFVGAARMFRRIVEVYPDPTVPIDEVHLRLAVAQAYLGNADGAAESLDAATRINAALASRRVDQVHEAIADAPHQQAAGEHVSAARHMALGSPFRRGVMPALPAGYFDRDLVPVWQFVFTPSRTFNAENYRGEFVAGPGEGGNGLENLLYANWREHHWRPAGDMLVSAQSIVFKGPADLLALDRHLTAATDKAQWRSVWLNQFVEDDATRIRNQIARAYGEESATVFGTTLRNPEQIQLFGDQIHQAMSIVGDVVYSLEGECYDPTADRAPTQRRRNDFQWGDVPRRTRSNALTAYNLATGEVLWRVPPVSDRLVSPRRPAVPRPDPASDEAAAEEPAAAPAEVIADPFAGAGFLGAPIGTGGVVLVPVTSDGALWLYALDPARQGALVWRSYLCDEPPGGCDSWSPIQLSASGSSVYVPSGAGVIFAIDALTGAVQFARRYPRTGRPNPYYERFGLDASQLVLDGWTQDCLIPVGNTLILVASDFDRIWAIDRQTGEFLWDVRNRPFGDKFDYVLGVYDDLLYVGGRESIAAISLKAQGRLEWVAYFRGETSYGRGIVTPEGLLVPIEDSIAWYDLHGSPDTPDGARLIRRVGVTWGVDAPVGNLVSDGERLWVAGANRLYVLQPQEPADPDASSAVPAALPSSIFVVQQLLNHW